jgi:hypothetical protein
MIAQGHAPIGTRGPRDTVSQRHGARKPCCRRTPAVFQKGDLGSLCNPASLSLSNLPPPYQPIHSFTGRVSCFPWRVTSRRRTRQEELFHPGLYNGIFSFAFTGGLMAPGILGYIAQRFGVGMIMVLPMLGTFMVFVLFLLILLEAKLSGDLPSTTSA